MILENAFENSLHKFCVSLCFMKLAMFQFCIKFYDFIMFLSLLLCWFFFFFFFYLMQPYKLMKAFYKKNF
jgi:hypothetical protein